MEVTAAEWSQMEQLIVAALFVVSFCFGFMGGNQR